MALTNKQLESICIKLSEGNSLRKICREMDLPESTVRYQLSKNEDMFAHSARAKELGCDALADECIEIADNPDIEPADKRIRIDTRIRLIGKWSQRYGDKLTVDSKKTVKHEYDLGKLSTAELEKLETILAGAEPSKGGTSEAEPTSVH